VAEGALPDSPKGVLSSQGPGVDARPPLNASMHTRLAGQAAKKRHRKNVERAQFPDLPGLDEGNQG